MNVGIGVSLLLFFYFIGLNGNLILEVQLTWCW